jgi:protein SCO1/2
MSRLKSLALLLAASTLLAVPARAQIAPGNVTMTQATTGSNTVPRTFPAKGVIKELNPDSKTVKIAHEAIPEYMGAMTMDFVVKDTNELRGLRTGDSVNFRIQVTDKDGWIDQVVKSGVVEVSGGGAGNTVRVVRDVPALKAGDELPDYKFTNELGKVVSTAQYKGQAIAFTFFFTRCPFPTFCPFLSNGYLETQRKMTATSGGPTNWHLFSITFDLENDTPAALKSYGERYGYDPNHWSFLTGDLNDITTIADQVGEYFGRDATGSINHNLRTVVVDAKGRIQTIIIGNTWTSDELVAELVKAAKVK